MPEVYWGVDRLKSSDNFSQCSLNLSISKYSSDKVVRSNSNIAHFFKLQIQSPLKYFTLCKYKYINQSWSIEIVLRKLIRLIPINSGSIFVIWVARAVYVIAIGWVSELNFNQWIAKLVSKIYRKSEDLNVFISRSSLPFRVCVVVTWKS